MLIEQIIIEHLKLKLNTDHVYAEMPEAIPGTFIVISTIDRGQVNFIGTVSVEVYSYAASKTDAAELDSRVRLVMRSLIENGAVSDVKNTRGKDAPDVWLEKYCYLSNYNIVYYDE